MAARKSVTAKAMAAAKPVETAMGKPVSAAEMAAAVAAIAPAISVTVIVAIIIIVVAMMSVGEGKADNASRRRGDPCAAAAPMAMMAVTAPGDGVDSRA